MKPDNKTDRVEEVKKKTEEDIRKTFLEKLDKLSLEYGDLSQLSTEELREYTRIREKQAGRKIDRKIKQEAARQRIIDFINRNEEIRRAFQEALDRLDREYGDLNQLSIEKLREYTQRKENLKDKMYDSSI
jgi:diketogulonate reductase-like aldo/keto reductase